MLTGEALQQAALAIHCPRCGAQPGDHCLTKRMKHAHRLCDERMRRAHSPPACAKPRRQCKACPWKTSTVPERDIPGGYEEELHRGLANTIADPGAVRLTVPRFMACHETTPPNEVECVGWVMHQLGPGNNIALRIAATDGRYENWRTVGPQHQRFEDTLPRGSR